MGKRKRLSKAVRKDLERAMCTMVDNEGVIIDALNELPEQEYNLRNVLRALRLIVDGEE